MRLLYNTAHTVTMLCDPTFHFISNLCFIGFAFLEYSGFCTLSPHVSAHVYNVYTYAHGNLYLYLSHVSLSKGRTKVEFELSGLGFRVYGKHALSMEPTSSVIDLPRGPIQESTLTAS